MAFDAKTIFVSGDIYRNSFRNPMFLLLYKCLVCLKWESIVEKVQISEKLTSSLSNEHAHGSVMEILNKMLTL